MSGYKGDETTGFQSPAQDYVEQVVDLTDYLDLTKPGMYPIRVAGQMFEQRGIYDGDILVVDAAAEPVPGKVCIAMIGGAVVLAVLSKTEGGWFLRPSTGIILEVADDVEVWAIVRSLIRSPV